MEHDGKNISPYKGFWQCCLILIIVPFIPFGIFYAAFAKFSSFSSEMNLYSALGLGFGVGFLFHLSCVLAGLFKGTFKVVVNRIATFLSDLRTSKKLAIMVYKDDLRENGMVFWPYFFIIISNLGVSIFGIVKFISLYTAS